METIKNFFENFKAENEKKLASIIKESISDRGFDWSTLDQTIKNELEKIEAVYKTQFIGSNNDETQDDTN